MTRIESIACAFALGVCMSISARADTNVVITSFRGNGELVWQDSNMTSYTVQWAPSANGPWSSSWAPLADIRSTEEPIRAVCRCTTASWACKDLHRPFSCMETERTVQRRLLIRTVMP